MEFQLAPTAIGEEYRLEALASVGSTNAHALERALAGDGGPAWFVTDCQENGRGRHGRNWTGRKGNLAATLLMTEIGDLAQSATLGFVAGIAVADALDAVAATRHRTPPRFQLKWPNDVLSDGAKMVGILLESVQCSDSRFAVAVGIGVNVASHPSDLPYPATSLAALGLDCSAAEVFLALSDAWVDNLRRWDNGRGVAAIRKSWLARAAGLGAEITVRLHGKELHGTFETIDEECRLVLRSRTGELNRISAGDVHFGAIARAEAV